MVGAKTGVVTRMNEIESHAYLTHDHGHTLETIKTIKIIRGTLDASFELNTTGSCFDAYRKLIFFHTSYYKGQ